MPNTFTTEQLFDNPVGSGKRYTKLYQDVIPKLLAMNEIDEAIKYLSTNSIEGDDLWMIVLMFGQKNNKNEISKKKLWDYTDTYLDFLDKENSDLKSEKAIQKRKSQIPDANSMISDFINSDAKTIDEYCEKSDISKFKFDRLRAIVKDYNPALFEAYSRIVEKQAAGRYAIVIEGLKKVRDCMLNGIVENEELRPFDIVDYYLLTKLHPDAFKRAIREISTVEENRQIAMFFRKNETYKLLKPKAIIEGKHVVNDCEITEEEKRDTINFLKFHEIPLYDRVYTTAIRRHLNGKLIPKQEEVTSKSR